MKLFEKKVRCFGGLQVDEGEKLGGEARKQEGSLVGGCHLSLCSTVEW